VAKESIIGVRCTRRRLVAPGDEEITQHTEGMLGQLVGELRKELAF
jgi:hypothetical protein